MPQSTFFVKACPTCSRKLQVRVEYLGREMVCNHCGGDFVAGDASEQVPECSDASTEDILLRADELLDETDRGFTKPR